MAVSNDYSLVNLEETGGSINQNYFYHICMKSSYSGFFADHNRLLSLLYYADYYGMQSAGIMISQLKNYKAVLKSRKENAALAGRLNQKAGAGAMA